MFFSYGIQIWTDLSSVLSGITRVTDGQTDRQTDGRTDRILIAIPRLHYMQRGKNKLCDAISRRLQRGSRIDSTPPLLARYRFAVAAFVSCSHAASFGSKSYV